LLLILACCVSGCASYESELTDAPPDAAFPVPKISPEAAYNAGMLDHERGDDAAARRELDRCIAASAPDSDSRLDCMVALEQMTTSSSQQP
jgi:hypothetical protein